MRSLDEHDETGRPTALQRWVRARPLTTVLLVVFGVFYPCVGLPRLLGHSIPAPVLQTTLAVLAFTLLFGSACAVTWLVDGTSGVRRLLGRLVMWRIGWLRFFVVTGALPVLTLATALVTGSLQHPAGGWPALVGSYLWEMVVLQALTTNLWEEGLWAGFVQVRLMQRHRLVVAALLTAVPFVLVPLPATFQNVSAAEGLVTVALLVCLAPMVRYLAGTLLADTGGSVLAVALLHASFNASGHLTAAAGGWQFLPALLVLTLLVVGVRLARRRHLPTSQPGSSIPALAVVHRKEIRA